MKTEAKKNKNYLIMKYALSFKNQEYTYEKYLKESKNNDLFMAVVNDFTQEEIKKINEYCCELDKKENYCIMTNGKKGTIKKKVIYPRTKRHHRR